MMIERNLDIGFYKFRITIESKSLHAHSLMTDSKDYIESKLIPLIMVIKDLVEIHKVKYVGVKDDNGTDT